MSYEIPLAVPDLSAVEERNVLEAIRSSWISSTGAFVDRFEVEFAGLCGTRAAISVSNGTVALHLALMGLNVQPGDEVIVPSLTYVATANAVRYVQAEPVFVDVDSETWCLDPRLLEERITDRTKGIVAVHLYGHPADMDALNRVAEAHGLWVVEDAAEAHFARYRGRPVGGLATVGTFSFYGNKIITSGEGGALTPNDPELEQRIRILRGQGMDPGRRYYFPITGYNYRLTNVACALLCAQIERRQEILAGRREVISAYHDLLADLPGIGFQPTAEWAEPAPWLFNVTVDANEFGLTRDELMDTLAYRGIETRPLFLPLHRLPPFRQESLLRGESLPVTDALAEAGISLPTHSRLTRAEVERVCAEIRAARLSPQPATRTLT